MNKLFLIVFLLLVITLLVLSTVGAVSCNGYNTRNKHCTPTPVKQPTKVCRTVQIWDMPVSRAVC